MVEELHAEWLTYFKKGKKNTVPAVADNFKNHGLYIG
jgi:hypothetical protein